MKWPREAYTPTMCSAAGASVPKPRGDRTPAGTPAVVFFGNTPSGRAAIPGDVPGDVYLGFPGVGGVMAGGTADYVRIRQQPTALPKASDPRLAVLEAILSGRGVCV